MFIVLVEFINNVFDYGIFYLDFNFKNDFEGFVIYLVLCEECLSNLINND